MVIIISGTTWVEEIIWLLRHGLDFEKAKKDFHFMRVPWIDQGFSNFTISYLPTPRVFKTHFPVRFLPENFNKIAKVITFFYFNV